MGLRVGLYFGTSPILSTRPNTSCSKIQLADLIIINKAIYIYIYILFLINLFVPNANMRARFRKMTKFNYKFGCSLKLQFPLKKKINITTYFENLTVRLYFFYNLHMSNFLSIRYYLIYDL